MISSTLFYSLFVPAIILITSLIGFAYLLGQFILKPESTQARALTLGLDFLTILLVNILFASFMLRYIDVIGDNVFQVIGFFCLAILMIISMQRLRSLLSQHQTLANIIWEISVLGIFPFPLFVINLSLHHYGSVKTLSYVEGAAFPSFFYTLSWNLFRIEVLRYSYISHRRFFHLSDFSQSWATQPSTQWTAGIKGVYKPFRNYDSFRFRCASFFSFTTHFPPPDGFFL